MASFQVRSRLDIAIARKKTAVTIFVDLVAAFYRAVRLIAVPIPTSMEEMEDIAKGLEVPPALQPALIELMRGTPIISEHITDQHLLALITETYTDTFFTVKGSKKCAASRTGTRPGDNLATDVFNLIFGKAVGEIEDTLRQHNLHWTSVCDDRVFSPDEANPTDATTSFVDDLAAQILLDSATDAIPRAQEMMLIINNVLAKYGMQLNYSKGKTAVMFTITGQGTRKATYDIWQASKSGIQVPHTPHLLQVVYQYKHLGGLIRHNNKAAIEIRQRSLQARSALTPLKRQIFRYPQIPLHQRLHYAEAYCASKLIYNMAIWANFTDAATATLNTAYIDIYRAATNTTRTPDRHVHDDETMHLTQRPALQHKLSHARLMFLGRLLRAHAPQLHTLLDELRAVEAPWTRHLQDDAMWLQRHQDPHDNPLQQD